MCNKVAKTFIPPVGSVESLNPFSSEERKKERKKQIIIEGNEERNCYLQLGFELLSSCLIERRIEHIISIQTF